MVLDQLDTADSKFTIQNGVGGGPASNSGARPADFAGWNLLCLSNDRAVRATGLEFGPALWVLDQLMYGGHSGEL